MLPNNHITVRDEYRAESRSGVVSKRLLMIAVHRVPPIHQANAQECKGYKRPVL